MRPRRVSDAALLLEVERGTMALPSSALVDDEDEADEADADAAPRPLTALPAALAEERDEESEENEEDEHEDEEGGRSMTTRELGSSRAGLLPSSRTVADRAERKTSASRATSAAASWRKSPYLTR